MVSSKQYCVSCVVTYRDQLVVTTANEGGELKGTSLLQLWDSAELFEATTGALKRRAGFIRCGCILSNTSINNAVLKLQCAAASTLTITAEHQRHFAIENGTIKSSNVY